MSGNVNYTLDQQTQQMYLPTRSTRRKIVVFSLLFCWGIIIYIMLYGNPDNSLHQSLASWSFFSWISIVFAYAISAGYETAKITALQETLLKVRNQS